MKPRGHIALCILALWAAGCGKTDRDLLPNQRKSFESYLSGKDYTVQGGVYRFVTNAQRDGYASLPEAKPGDSLAFDFAEYSFASSRGRLVTTNIFPLVEGDPILDTSLWSFAPRRVKLGETPLLEGLQRGLEGCRQGDSVVLLLTSDLAYGSKAVGPVAANGAVMFSLNILTVK